MYDIIDVAEVRSSFYENISAKSKCKKYFKLSNYFKFSVALLASVLLFLTHAGSNMRKKSFITCDWILTQSGFIMNEK